VVWNRSDRDAILHRVRHLKPSWSFRSKFSYQNIMYLVAGRIAEEIVGEPWDTIIQRRIFGPLKMTSSNTSVEHLQDVENVATPHASIQEIVQLVAWRNIDNIAPAGSINSNMLDMAQWVRLQLGEGLMKANNCLALLL
jgi:CubicO group peptidase (beta-lactamase class C family)